MRHRKKTLILDRKKAPRLALLRTQAISLINHGKITTTSAKAKALNVFIEKIFTMAVKNTLAGHRQINQILNNEKAAQMLFKKWVPKLKNKKSGHLALTKIGFRKGDNAEITQIEIL